MVVKLKCGPTKSRRRITGNKKIWRNYDTFQNFQEFCEFKFQEMKNESQEREMFQAFQHCAMPFLKTEILLIDLKTLRNSVPQDGNIFDTHKNVSILFLKM